MRVFSPSGDFNVHPAATDEWAVVSEADVVFLGLKAYSLPEAAPRLAELLQPDAAVIAAQNGIPWWYFQSHGGPFDGLVLASVDSKGVISRSLPPTCAVGCVAECSTQVVAPGVIKHRGGARFALGEPDRRESERCRKIAAVLETSGLDAPITTELRTEIWLKLLGTGVFNPVSTLTGATMAQLKSTRAMREMLHEASEEIASVADRLGVRFSTTTTERLEAGFSVGDHKTSMLQDFEQGKPLEYQCMTGAVLELADLLNVSAPTLRAIHACIDLLERTRFNKQSSNDVVGSH
jgi:2-dehydropantoate 2-reductase